MGYYFTTTCERMMRVFVIFFFISCALGCTSNLECGSADDSAPGLCENGICQCGVGYSGNQPIDPTSCSLVCAPPPVPDAKVEKECKDKDLSWWSCRTLKSRRESEYLAKLKKTEKEADARLESERQAV